jgi:exodeoxyribonuclease V
MLQNEEVLEAGQVLVGTNSTRRSCNQIFRQLLKRQSPYPEKGDRLVCLRNRHDRGLLNGSLWCVEKTAPPDGDDEIQMLVKPEDEGTATEISTHKKYFEGREEDLDMWTRKRTDQFTYGYAITVHKAQGSQWNDVVIFNEASVFRENHSRWLYTAVTRAVEHFTLVGL